MATAIKSVQTQSELDGFDMDEFRRLARCEFYASLRRRAPVQLVSIPSYVKAVKRQFHLVSGNQARQVLATIEGYKDWPALMAAMLRQVK